MSKNLIEFNSYTADVVDYTSYDSTKTVLGADIKKVAGATPVDYYIGPNEIGFRDLTVDTGVFNWGDIDAITYNNNTQWLFCLKGAALNVSTSDIAMYEFNKTNYSYTYKGEIRTSGANENNSSVQEGIKASLNYYSAGTVSVNGTAVTGTGTNWIDRRIPIGARIGFGSTNPAAITTWYRITDYPLMNSQPSKINQPVYCTVVDPATGKIYIGGNFTIYGGVTVNRIARLNVDGTLDTTFNSGTGFDNQVFTIALDSAGKLYVGGAFTTYNGVANVRIIKLNSDGTKDTSFDNSTGGFNSSVYTINFDSLGKIWVGGLFLTYKGVSAPYVTKLNTDGSRDATYPNTVNPNGNVVSIAVDNNNDVYVGGSFTQVGAIANNARYIAKILKLGGLDPTFDAGAAGTSNAFNGFAKSMFYKSSTNTIIVGGDFTTWKGIGNVYLTELSATGTVLISSMSNVNINGINADGLGNIYCYGNSQIITKRNINTLITDPIFNPNVIYALNGLNVSDKQIAINPTGDRIYVTSGNATIDSGIVCVESTGGTRDTTFFTSQDWKSQSITINASAGVLSAGTPYVIEDLKFYFMRGNTFQILQGISVDDFTVTPTNIAAPTFNFMALSKGRYNALDASYVLGGKGYNTVVNSTLFKDVNVRPQIDASTHYVYGVSNTGGVSRFNVRASYITQLGTGASGQIRFSTSDQVIATGTGVRSDTGGTITGFATGKFAIATMQSGSAAGTESIYLDFSGVAQTPMVSLVNGVQPVYNYMPEQPPGSTTTYPAAGNVGRVYFVPEIDRLVILNSGTTVKSYITGFNNNLLQPTLSTTRFNRTTYDALAIQNSFDLAFLVNGNQLQSTFASSYAPKYPDTLGTGFFGAVENGVLHMCRSLNSIQNTLYALPIACEAEYVDQSNNVFITPKYILPNAINISGLYVNTQKEYGTFPFVMQPEPIFIDYRTEGIDDNSGTWFRFTNINDLNDAIICDGVLENISIQFRFSYKIAGIFCLPNKIYGFSLVYEDDRTDSNYSPSVSKSNLANRIFAWRQEKPWYGNIPDLKIRLYNATNSKIVYYDSVTASDSGTWEYSTDGITWLPWDATADTVGNYIRYAADFIPNGIKLRVGLNKI